MKRKTGNDGQVKYLGQGDVRKLLAAAKRRGVRDHLLLALSYRLGLRVSEAVGLEFGSVDLPRREIAVRGLKGGLERSYSIPPDLLPLVRRWVRLRGDAPGRFFVGRQGAQLTRQRALQIVKACARNAGLAPWVRFHTLRHSVGVHMVDALMPLESVKDLLRHQSIRSTEVYAHTSLERRSGYLREMERATQIVKVL